MNRAAKKCHICGARSRNLCLTAGRIICPTCCHSKRGVEIVCSPDCRYYPFNIMGYDSWLKIDAGLTHKIVNYVIDAYGRNYFQETIEHMWPESGPLKNWEAVAIGTAVYHLLFVEHSKDNQTLAQHWKGTGWRGLNREEATIMNYRLNSRVTIIEIQKILDNQAMECIDLLDSQRGMFILLDRSLAAHTVRFARFLTWLTHYPNFSRPEFIGIEISDFIAKEFMEMMQKGFKEESKRRPSFTIKDHLSENFSTFCRLAFELRDKKQIAMLKGMDLHQCRASYKIEGKLEEIKAILDRYPDFELREGDSEKGYAEGVYHYDWLRRGRSKTLEAQMPFSFRHDDEDGGVGIIGGITLYPDGILLETFTKQKYEFAKKMVKKYFKGKLTLQEEMVVDMAKQFAERLHSKDADGFENEEFFQRVSRGPEELIPIEIERKIIQDFYKSHYQRFMEDRIPALNNLTPPQAAKDPKMRPRLISLMKEHLKGIEKQNREKGLDLNLDWVLDELNLPELKL